MLGFCCYANVASASRFTHRRRRSGCGTIAWGSSIPSTCLKKRFGSSPRYFCTARVVEALPSFPSTRRMPASDRASGEGRTGVRAQYRQLPA